MKICGVYQIRSTVDGKVYIGGSQNVPKRWRQHLRELKNNAHHNKSLQEHFIKYGESRLIFEILLECSTENLRKYEQICLDFHDFKKTFNINPDVSSLGKIPRTKEHVDKIRRALSGKTRPLKVGLKIKTSVAKKRGLKRKKYAKKHKVRRVKVVAYGENGFHRAFYSINDCADFFRCSRATIWNCLSGRQKKLEKNYYFKYIDGDDFNE